MSDASLRQYFASHGLKFEKGVRALHAISLRMLLGAANPFVSKLIHISDLHFTSSSHTWEIGKNYARTFFHDTPDNEGRLALADYLIQLRQSMGVEAIIITGDITDGAGDGDFEIAREFINKLKNSGYSVYVIPGNHDYCWEGNLFFEDLFRAVKVIDTAAVVTTLGAAILSAPPFPLLFESHMAASIAAAKSTTLALIDAAIRTELAIIFPGILIPEELVATLAAMFSVAVEVTIAGATVGISITDTVDNNTRRQRFIDYITPETGGVYPRVVDFANARIVLLDSMEGELDESGRDQFAQGKIGKKQLDSLRGLVGEFQIERKGGKKLMVCLHHSPFKVPNDDDEKRPDSKYFDLENMGCLSDWKEFIDIIGKPSVAGELKIDCLLFGHTSPDGSFHRPRDPRIDYEDEWKVFDYYQSTYAKLVNCENLEHATRGGTWGYPVSIIDLTSMTRTVTCLKN